MKVPAYKTSGETLYLDARECAERYGFSAQHWRRLSDAGRVPQPRRFGRLVRWSRSCLDEWDLQGNKSLH